jgi:hypothetical protein
MRLAAAFLVALALVLAAGGARAQSNSEAAQRAFEAGMKLMEAHRYEEACIKLEESQRIEPGMGTQFRLAECYERTARIASAWRNYDAVATAARAASLATTNPAEKENLQKREAYSRSRADALLALVARATIQVPADVALLPGLTVSVDGAVIPPAGWGSVPLDRGKHRVVAVATGKAPFTSDVEVTEDAQRLTIEVTHLDNAAVLPLEQPEPSPPLTEGGIGPVAIAGIVVGVLGLGGMGAGVGLGFAAKSKHGDSDAFCVDDRCTADGVAIRDDARTLGDIGTGVFIAGAVLAAGGLVMILVSPPAQPDGAPAVEAQLGPTGAALRVSF